MKSLRRFSFTGLSIVTLFCAASGLTALACGGDDAAQTNNNAGSAGSGGAAGSATGGSSGAGGGSSGASGSANGGNGGAAGSDGGVEPPDGGTDAGGDGAVAQGKKRQAFAIVSAGNVSKSQNFTLISTMGQGAAMNGSSKSANYRLNPGVVGATQ